MEKVSATSCGYRERVRLGGRDIGREIHESYRDALKSGFQVV